MKTTLQEFILTLVFVIGLLPGNYFAQGPTWQWAKGAGSTGSEAATGSALDASGNLYVTGWFGSASINFGSTTLINAGNFTGDLFLVKYDPAGNVIWAKQYGGVDGESGNGVAVDNSGNVYVTGWYTSANLVMGSYTLTNSASGSTDIFIAKIDPSGNTIWAKSAGGSSADKGTGIAVDASGNVFTTGNFASTTINFGTGALTNAGAATTDFFLVKYDPNGNTLWSKSAGGSNSDGGTSVAIDSLGNVYITGMFSSTSINFGTGALTNAASNTQDLFVAKYNGLGTAAWSVRSGGSLDDYGNSIAIKKNNIYVTGGFNSASLALGTTTLTNASAGTSDVLLVKYDDTGNALWAKRSGSTDSEAGNGVAVDSFGNVYVTGYFSSSSIAFDAISITNSSFGYRDLFVAAYNPTGIALWATQEGDAFDETSNCISVSGSGIDVCVGGVFNSGSVAFGAYTIFKGCGDDVFVAKLFAPLVAGVKEEYFAEAQAVYPNPTSGKFTIEGEGQIFFYNVLGENILNQKLKSENEFDFSSYPKGIYWSKVLTEKKGGYTGRIVVE
jgi:hypothetical protein